MHSFQPSRGRIFFEVLCAVGIAASCGGAWMQTGASALLAAAAVATLYALVHFFDLFRRAPAAAVEPQRIEFEPEPVVVPVRQNVGDQLARIEEQLAARNAGEAPLVDTMEAAEPITAKPSEGRAKAPRKAGSRRSNSAKKAKVAEPEPVEEVVEFAHRDESVEHEQMAIDEPVEADEPTHPPLAPLFEPEPFVRQQQRSMFGRKSG